MNVRGFEILTPGLQVLNIGNTVWFSGRVWASEPKINSHHRPDVASAERQFTHNFLIHVKKRVPDKIVMVYVIVIHIQCLSG